MTEYLACYECCGNIIEETEIMFPCLRFKGKDVEFPDDCPKKARGVDIKETPRWKNISKEAFNIYWFMNKQFGTRVRFFEEEENGKRKGI